MAISANPTASEINVELGRAATAPFSIDGAEERALAGVPSGPISFSDFIGKSAGITISTHAFSSAALNDGRIGFADGLSGISNGGDFQPRKAGPAQVTGLFSGPTAAPANDFVWLGTGFPGVPSDYFSTLRVEDLTTFEVVEFAAADMSFVPFDGDTYLRIDPQVYAYLTGREYEAQFIGSVEQSELIYYGLMTAGAAGQYNGFTGNGVSNPLGSMSPNGGVFSDGRDFGRVANSSTELEIMIGPAIIPQDAYWDRVEIVGITAPGWNGGGYTVNQADAIRYVDSFEGKSFWAFPPSDEPFSAASEYSVKLYAKPLTATG